ncbi:UNVERIFIED_CONTAM: hypothetical protein PYX00_002481 [Menopon gallinae]|uniref:Sorbin and SH3 domain-containing protein 1 n=2 Tax=Menopon gallinae TaxID=328185 RepID=A0AAW2IGW7_9NEOP
MPKKNGRKGFSFMGTKSKDKSETELKGEAPPIKERYSSFVQVDTKSKAEVKKQKKKDRKQMLELEKVEAENRNSVQMSEEPGFKWESANEFEACEPEGAVAHVEEDVLEISEVDVFDDEDRALLDSSPTMNEEEERSLREFLRTLEIVDTRVREQSEYVSKSINRCGKSDSDYELVEFSRGIKTAEPIIEEVFEEMVEDGVTKFSPTVKNQERVKVEETPRILYSYNGIPFAEQDKKTTILVQDIDDGILVINNIRCKERERYPFRQLDVIMEESSDMSDTSSVQSDKKVEPSTVYKTILDKRETIFDGRGKTFDLQIQPVIKETVRVFPLHQNGLKTDSTQVRIQTVVLEKVHPTSIVKIQVPDEESDEEKHKTQNEAMDVVDPDERCYENVESKEKKQTLSGRNVLHSSSEIKFIDEDSEPSLSSGGFNVEDGVDADVESELDSRRDTFLVGGGDSDDLLIEVDGMSDYGTIKKSPFKKEAVDDNKEEKANDGEELPTTIRNNCENMVASPTFSGRDSASSVASGGTVKNLGDAAPTKNDKEFDRIPETVDFDFDSLYKDTSIAAQVDQVKKDVNVRERVKAMEKDMDKILRSKLKVIEYFQEPIMSEASWSSILGNTKDDDEVSRKSDFSLVKFKHYSNSSSYENISKSRESVFENENIYEVISPEALSNLAEKKVMSLPNGHFLLRKIGLGRCCEEEKDAEDDIYTKIDAKVRSASVGSQHLPRSTSTSSSKTRCLPCGKSSKKQRTHPYIEFSSPTDGQPSEKWYGMRTSHPSVLLGLSPSQKKVYEQSSRQFDEEEAASLLDLHKKFIERRCYNEGNPFRRDRTVVYDSKEVIYSEVTPKVVKKSNDIGSCGLLAILQNAASDDSESNNKKTSCGSGAEETTNEQRKEHKFGPKSKWKEMGAMDKEKDQEEECVVTKSLSSVSEVVKSFEEPIPPRRSPARVTGDVRVLVDNEKYRISRKGDIAVLESENGRRRSMLTEQEEFKQRMYDEYMSKVAERLERRQHKMIKMSEAKEVETPEEGKFSGIENEFIGKVKERMEKLGLTDPFEELFEEEMKKCQRRGSSQLVLDATSDLAGLPKHLQELLQADEDDGSAMISPTFKATAPRPGIWSPVQTTTTAEEKTEVKEENEERKKLDDEPIPPVWTPKSAQASPILERREFRPVNFESPTLPRKKYIREERSESVPPPWEQPGGDRQIELAKTPSSPALSLPKAPNPTVTLLQKAREGHIPRGAHYLNYSMSESLTDDGSLSQQNGKSYSFREDLDRPKKVELGPKKIIGIGPTTKEGIPLVLRSEVTDENKEKWYKRMYDSLHKAGKDEDYVTVKYRTSPSRKGLYGYQPISSSGYQSEPESIIYDSNRYNKYTTLDRRRSEKSKENDYISVTLPRSRASTPRYGSEPYRNQPGRIEDYEPGHSSISELEARQQEERGQPIHKAQSPKSFMTYALKDSGYISDPQHVFKRREDDYQSQLSPQEQKEAYRVIQKGGEVPLRGLRKPAPERPKESVAFAPEAIPRDSSPDSPRKYVESEVTIHYKSPVRSEAKAVLPEDELARRQAESMKRIYKEERRRKYLQELQDMNSRRHADNFIPSQKSPIPLNRYDDFPFDGLRAHSTEPVLVARGLYDFVGRRPRELAFRRGDIIFIIRQLDKNWCEGELNGAVGLFPLSYVEIIPYNEYNPKFGRARAKYDFVPQTSLELSARKGEMITLVRKIDENWFEGRIGDRTGIIPASYCQVLSLPQIKIPSRSERATSSKPVAAPAAHSLIHNGSSVPSKHYYTPYLGGRSSPSRSTNPAVREAHAAIDQLIDEALFHLEEDFDRRRTPKPLNLRVNPRPEPAL